MTQSPATYACELREVPARPTLSLRLRAPVSALPQRLGEAYGVVYGCLEAQDAVPAGPPFVAYYNMDMQDLDLEAGVPLASPLPGRGEVQPGTLPAGRQAVCLHVGPYSAIGPAYDALLAWMEAQGFTGTGVAYEFYLNDPAATPPEALETEVVMPLR